MKKITIAIDGHSSTGKSTLAKQLATHLNYIHVDSGAMYRAVTLFGLEHGIIAADKFDHEKLIDAIQNIKIEFKTSNDHTTLLFLNNSEVSSEIRNLKVSNFVSRVAAIPEIRLKLVAEQRRMGQDKGIVMDGRDIGTVVFPDAELKIFMTASAETRAKRRFRELQNENQFVDFNAVLENIKSRDFKDSTRKTSPLKQADDALVLDNSTLTQQEQFDLVLGWVNNSLRG